MLREVARGRGGVLEVLTEEEYGAGMRQLEREIEERGEGALVVSEMTLMAVEVATLTG